MGPHDGRPLIVSFACGVALGVFTLLTQIELANDSKSEALAKALFFAFATILPHVIGY